MKILGNYKLMIVVAFVLGFAAGGLTVSYTSLHKLLHPSHRLDSKKRGDRDRFLRYLTKELGLSEEQANKIGQINKQTRKETREAMKTVEPQIKAINDKAKAEIEKELTPEQQKRYREIMSAFEEKMKKRMAETEKPK